MKPTPELVTAIAATTVGVLSFLAYVFVEREKIIPPILRFKDRIWPGKLAKQTCYKWESAGHLVTGRKETKEIVNFLGQHYGVSPFSFGEVVFPIANLWSTTELFPPDRMLGKCVANFDAPPYSIPKEELEFIKMKIEAEDRRRNKRPHNDTVFRMVEFRFENGVPQIDGSLGKYYEHLLSQHSLRWELGKICAGGGKLSIDRLPRRKHFEEVVPKSHSTILDAAALQWRSPHY